MPSVSGLPEEDPALAHSKRIRRYDSGYSRGYSATRRGPIQEAMGDLTYNILAGVEDLRTMRESITKIELCILLLTILIYVAVTGSFIIFLCRCCLKRRSKTQFQGAMPLSVASLSKSGSVTSLRGHTQGMGPMGITKANCQQYQYPPHLIPRIQIDNPPTAEAFDEDDPRLMAQPLRHDDDDSSDTQQTDIRDPGPTPEKPPITTPDEPPRRSSLEKITLAEDVV